LFDHRVEVISGGLALVDRRPGKKAIDREYAPEHRQDYQPQQCSERPDAQASEWPSWRIHPAPISGLINDTIGKSVSQTIRLMHRQLLQLLASRSTRRGNFTLASGKQSSFYVDARLTTMSPEGLSLIGPLGLEIMAERGWEPDSIGGLTLGADPVSYAISYASAVTERPIRAFTVRKEAKSHGTGKLIEGPFAETDRVVVIEDVITTGGSALRAIEAIRATGAKVQGVLAVVDREEGGREAIEATGVAVASMALASEILPLTA
jgi:orotate phosphoribosyltransferase